MTNNWKNQNFLKAFLNALNGIMHTIKNERNIRIQLFFGIAAIVLGGLLKISLLEWVILIITISIVIITELINTAIENTVDLITSEYNEKAKIAKDVAAGAVLVTAINSIIVGTAIFGTKIFSYLR